MARQARLVAPAVGEVGVGPAGEDLAGVVGRLSVAQQHERAAHLLLLPRHLEDERALPELRQLSPRLVGVRARARARARARVGLGLGSGLGLGLGLALLLVTARGDKDDLGRGGHQLLVVGFRGRVRVKVAVKVRTRFRVRSGSPGSRGRGQWLLTSCGSARLRSPDCTR